MDDCELLSAVAEIRQEIVGIEAAINSVVFRLDTTIKRHRNLPSLDELINGAADTRSRRAIEWAAHELGCDGKDDNSVAPLLAMTEDDWRQRRNIGPKTYAAIHTALSPHRASGV